MRSGNKSPSIYYFTYNTVILAPEIDALTNLDISPTSGIT